MWFRRKKQSELSQLGFELMDVCSGVFAVGTTGSGKTSLLRIFLALILSEPFRRSYSGSVKRVAGLWCCVKKDEAQNALNVIRNTPMRDCIKHLIPGKGLKFNFVSFELNQKEGGNPASLARRLQRLSKQLNNASEGGSNQSFWAALEYDYLHFAIWIAWLAHRKNVNIEHVHDVIVSSPTSAEHAQSEAFRQSACWQMLQMADKQVRGEAEDRALFKAGEFYLMKQPSIGDAARGAGIQMSTTVLASFLIEPMYSVVVTTESNFTPEMALSEYWCILDAPILVHATSGQLFQSLVTMRDIGNSRVLRIPRRQLPAAFR